LYDNEIRTSFSRNVDTRQRIMLTFRTQ